MTSHPAVVASTVDETQLSSVCSPLVGLSNDRLLDMVITVMLVGVVVALAVTLTGAVQLMIARRRDTGQAAASKLLIGGPVVAVLYGLGAWTLIAIIGWPWPWQ